MDMQSPVVSVLIHLMLSQARESVLQQLLLHYTPGGANDLLHCVELAQDCATVCPSVFDVFYVCRR